MALIWNAITETIKMASSVQSDGIVVYLVVELLRDGSSEWTVQYSGHHQRSGVSSTPEAAIAAAETIMELDRRGLVDRSPLRYSSW
jgi:hypothetical protein